MTNLGLPDNRPALEWVANLPPDWTTNTERLLLLALALDSFDGLTCAPGRDGLMRLAGMKYVSTFTRARDALAQATEYRPALIAVDAMQGRHTRYRLLVRDTQTGHVGMTQTGDVGLTQTSQDEHVRTTQTTEQDADMSAQPVRETCPHDMSAQPVGMTQTYPPSPPTLREEEEGGEALTAPAPKGAALPRLPADQVSAWVQAVVPAVAYGTGIDTSNADLGQALATVQAAGWTTDKVAAALANMQAPKKSATGQLIARLTKLGEIDPSTILTAPPNGTTEPDAEPAPTLTRDPLADASPTFITRLCKRFKWKESDFRQVTADLLRDGFQVLPQQDIAMVFIDDDSGTWLISAEYTPTSTRVVVSVGDQEAPVSDGAPDHLRRELSSFHPRHIGDPRDDGEVEITFGRLTLDQLQALAVAVRHLTPRLLSHMDLPLEQSLDDDTRDPGAEGFGHIDPPNRTAPRPAGFDQAQREADEIERKRQAEALAALDGLTDEQLAEVLTTEQLAALTKHRNEGTAS